MGFSCAYKTHDLEEIIKISNDVIFWFVRFAQPINRSCEKYLFVDRAQVGQFFIRSTGRSRGLQSYILIYNTQSKVSEIIGQNALSQPFLQTG